LNVLTLVPKSTGCGQNENILMFKSLSTKSAFVVKILPRICCFRKSRYSHCQSRWNIL